MLDAFSSLAGCPERGPFYAQCCAAEDSLRRGKRWEDNAMVRQTVRMGVSQPVVVRLSTGMNACIATAVSESYSEFISKSLASIFPLTITEVARRDMKENIYDFYSAITFCTHSKIDRPAEAGPVSSCSTRFMFDISVSEWREWSLRHLT